MTPHVAAARMVAVANLSASGDQAARAELGKFISAIKSFDKEIREVFIGALADAAVKFLLSEHGAAIEKMNQELHDLLTERGTA